MLTYLLAFASRGFCKKDSLTREVTVICNLGVPSSEPVLLSSPTPTSPFPLLAHDLYTEKEIHHFSPKFFHLFEKKSSTFSS